MSTFLRNKTLKKGQGHDLSGDLIGEAFRKSVETQDSLVRFLIRKQEMPIRDSGIAWNADFG